MSTKKTYRLFWLAVLITLAVVPSAAQAYIVKGHATGPIPGWVPYGAVVEASEVDGTTYNSITLTNAPVIVGVDGEFTLKFDWPDVSGEPFPDLILRYTQNVNGQEETIYKETPSETNWDVANGSTIDTDIMTSDRAIYIHSATGVYASLSIDKYFLFTRVGNCQIDSIDCKGNDPNSKGYYRPRKPPFSFDGDSSDMPFGSTLDLFAWFGKKCRIGYYKVQYSSDGGASWKDVNTTLYNQWYDGSSWVIETMGPITKGNQDNLYKIPYFERSDPWCWPDLVARFNTTLADNGTCRIRVLGYKKSGKEAKSEGWICCRDIIYDPKYGEIVLQIDNTPPTVEIKDLKKNGDSIPVCSIVELGDKKGDAITVEFCAWDSLGHLRDYGLSAIYGHDCYVSPVPTVPHNAADNYGSISATPLWHGSKNYVSGYIGSSYGITPTSPCTPRVMPTCAYQFRLHAGKRTTNGYGRIYRWIEDTWHITIERTR